MKKEDYKNIKLDVIDSRRKLDKELKDIDEKLLYAQKIATELKERYKELAVPGKGGESTDLEIRSIKRLLIGVEEFSLRCELKSQELKMKQELVKSMNVDKIEKVSFAEKRVISSSIKNLKKICDTRTERKRDDINATFYNQGASVFEIMAQEANLVKAYVDYCIDSNGRGTVESGFSFVEKNFDKLLSAQRGYDKQIQVSNKILKEEANFRRL